MKRFMLLLFALPLLFFAQEWNWNFMGSGARALGMGGAFISIADDASSITWNPSGIAQLIKPEISFCGIFKTESWDPGPENEALYWYGYSYKHFIIDYASAVFPISIGGARIVFSFAYHSMLERYYQNEDTFQLDWGQVYHFEKLSNPFIALTPAMGFNIGPFSLGASFDFWKFGPKYRWYEEIDSIGINYTYEYKESNNPSSIGINLGALFTSPMFRFGGTIKLPHKLKQKIKWEEKWTGDIQYSERGEDDGTELGFPIMFGFGGSIILGNIFTIALDYEIRPYSKMTFNGVTDTSVYDCNQLRVGAELMLNIEKMAIPFRIGYMTDPRTYEDMNGQVVGHTFTSGFGLVIDRISFDIAGSFGFSQEQYESTWDPAYNMVEPGLYTKFNLIFSTTIRL